MTLPNINLNGTAATELLEQQIQVLHNLRATLTSLAKSTPHGRDYPMWWRKECRIDDHGGFGAAREEHFARLAKIREIMLEVEAIAEHCSDTVNAGLWPRHHGRRI
jgi:hypothetical protein